MPSRWLYPSLLFLATVTASVFERGLRRAGRARAWLEVAMLPAVAWIAFDIASVSRLAMGHAFVNHMPKVAESTGPFHTEITLPRELDYSSDYAPPSLPAEMANIGTIACGTFPGLNVYVRDQDGRLSGLGARGRSDPLYRGEAYVAEGLGTAEIVSFSPNAITVKVTGSQAGDHLVLNQNWDGGWRANGEPVAQLVRHDRDAAPRRRLDGRLPLPPPVLVPRRLRWCAATLGAIVYAYRLRRRSRMREVRRRGGLGFGS